MAPGLFYFLFVIWFSGDYRGGKLRKGGRKMQNRIAAVLVGLAITFSLERWAGFQWYLALPLGVLGYGGVLYIPYFMRGRRYLKKLTDET